MRNFVRRVSCRYRLYHLNRWIRSCVVLVAFGVVVAFSIAMNPPSGGIQAQSITGDNVTSSPHGNLDLACNLCHGTKGWKPAKISAQFDHSKYGYALNGAHAKTECKFCHTDLHFTGAKKQCVACHQDVHQGELGVDCGRCHETRSFIDRSSQVNMHRTTRFPLAGSHANLDCDQCHAAASRGSLRFVNTPTTCYACHVEDYAQAKSPDHASGGFSHDCTQCHTSVAWPGASGAGDHAFFPLRGGHGGLDCARCHLGGVFQGLDARCVACHEEAFAATVEPNHVQAEFGTDCAKCHTITAWTGAEFDHTSFPLTAGHSGLSCTSCHGNGVYRGLQSQCYACHEQDFVSTVDPNHVQSGFSTDCTQCHTTTAWAGAQFDHSSFPLTGGHSGLTCVSCHTSGVYQGLNSQCYACHEQDFMSTVDPNHGQAGFSTDCTQCHTTTAWAGAQFDHSTFPLTGGHSGLSCASCHTNGVYQGLSRDCVSCHRTDYDTTTNPNHLGAGFGTDCAVCHNPTSWFGASFDHDTNYFPIYSGTHRNRWQDCTECHTNSASFSVFTCFACHAHAQTRMDNKHTGVGGYTYDSNACYDCHPRGRKD